MRNKVARPKNKYLNTTPVLPCLFLGLIRLELPRRVRTLVQGLEIGKTNQIMWL